MEIIFKEPPVYKKKCPEIPILNCYRSCPDSKFWDIFPKNNKTEQHVNIEILEQKINSCKHLWTIHEKRTAKIAVKNVKFGTISKFKDKCPT